MSNFAKDRIFTTVMDHLIVQNRQSYDTEREICVYKHKDGLKCAIGCLIPDEEYSPKLEGMSLFAEDFLSLCPTVAKLYNKPECDELLLDLQHLHDNAVGEFINDKTRDLFIDEVIRIGTNNKIASIVLERILNKIRNKKNA